MSTTRVTKLIEEEIALKEQLKELRQELKLAVEETEFYKGMLSHAQDIPDLEIDEKTAQAHAYRVTYEAFSPPKAPKEKKKKDK